MTTRARLPPTSLGSLDAAERPYFLWWASASLAEFRQHLRSPDPEVRAYWAGALLREANTRDVFLFVTPDELRELWPSLVRHLGRSRDMWAWLLDLPAPVWPPEEARGA